jgi:glc operon protein GlcG
LPKKTQSLHATGRTSPTAAQAAAIIAGIERLLPEYLANKTDREICDGNVAVCIIDAQGGVYGRLFGLDKNRMRQAYKVAWTKASQVWITGMKTGEYEHAVFTHVVDEKKFGIIRPDFIGWEGGQPLVLKDGTRLSVGVSGMRGTSDLEIAARAVAAIG